MTDREARTPGEQDARHGMTDIDPTRITNDGSGVGEQGNSVDYDPYKESYEAELATYLNQIAADMGFDTDLTGEADDSDVVITDQAEGSDIDGP